MNLKLYKIKVSIFVNFLVFLMIFLTGISFILFHYVGEKNNLYHKILNIENRIKELSNKEIISFLNNLSEISLINIVDNIVGNENSPEKQYIYDNFGIKFLNIYEGSLPIYIGFDSKLCKGELECKKISKGDYIFLFAVKRENFEINKSILIFFIFSLLISILFYPIIYWIVSRLTKTIEINFKFMKNFVNNAGHELKTPLANINLSAQILLNKKGYDEEIIKEIESESGKLSQLIDTLLQMSILSKFQNKEKINIKKEIETIIKQYKDLIENKKIKLKLNMENIEKEINPNHLNILIKNLLSNAIKYNITNGKINIILNNDKLIIENTGKEIPQKERKKIFDIFYRLDKDNNGYGLGLALVKKIIDINKWKVQIESKNGLNKFIIKF